MNTDTELRTIAHAARRLVDAIGSDAALLAQVEARHRDAWHALVTALRDDRSRAMEQFGAQRSKAISDAVRFNGDAVVWTFDDAVKLGAAHGP